MSATIHVYLLDEGVDVWRPVSAELVRCRKQNFSGKETGLVAYEKIAS
jgi:hypothetical protein